MAAVPGMSREGPRAPEGFPEALGRVPGICEPLRELPVLFPLLGARGRRGGGVAWQKEPRACAGVDTA